MRTLGIASLALALVACQGNAGVKSEATPAPKSSNRIAELQTQLGMGYMREAEACPVGDARCRQQKLDLAWKRLHSAIEADATFSTAQNAMGVLYEKLGQPDKAEEHLRRAVELDPSDSSAQNNLGSLLCARGHYEEGEQRFLQAVKNTLYSSPQDAYANAGLCMKQAGKRDKAESYFRSALHIDPKLPLALLAMSEISYDGKHYLQARGYLQRYLEVGRHNARTLWLGIRIERKLGDKNAASSYAMLLKAKYPDSHETQLLLKSGDQ